MGCTTSSIPHFIPDQYKTIGEVQKAIREAGLESSNLIFGIDFTGSNVSTGSRTFQGRSLHDISVKNPYMEAIEIMGETLEAFDDDHLIPAYIFGDSVSTDKTVTPFFQDRFCNGFKEVLERYKQLVPVTQLSGPTDFAPLINEAIRIVKQEKSYHILVILTDGQVNCEEKTTKAIVEASKFPLSIICVGVGDGPWGTMETFDDRVPKRIFDNFQFVAFHNLKKRYIENFAPAFAVAALQEIPDQYKAIRKLKYLDQDEDSEGNRV
ncbi:putative copine-like protein [Monocercomonoides exilis]|uniref:putative copine-like protein n=1 Tax=Monocercomonoides exilis TaxID=2049356 RepID=UPI003559D334|nr:putative copine-like protein [Monocercomonoides exilis]|eukprot:MONOS_9587.1-p1 / transcript=MONOS_9587.1 / gene=MONOS_9587 / organism=Monocercomonoides_exilis_PA203 / gene_product=copine-like protein, putative / transcript_product=copine-like protein, putative / location=Mono_scaffold00401:25170-27419(+) / protein_length=265 / sequence_SO=supercontig / SO=protein_coding / is_pseudo=false